MAHVREANHPSTQFSTSMRTSARHRRTILRPARLTALLLLIVWIGPVTFVHTDAWRLLRFVGAPDRASAESQVIPAGSAMVLEPGTRLRLRMRDGSVRQGRFQRRALLDSALYAPRFAANAKSSSFVPFMLGEILHVSLRDGREWVAPFAGYAELTLLLRSSDGSAHRRVPFEVAAEIRREDGDLVEPASLIRAFQAGLLPSAEALVLDGQRAAAWGGLVEGSDDGHAVAVEDIAAVTAETSSGIGVGGVIVLSVIVSVIVFYVLLAHTVGSAFDRCGSTTYGIPTLETLGHVRLTTRPFDRSRGCYVGDELAVVDPSPAPATPVAAIAHPAALQSLAE